MNARSLRLVFCLVLASIVAGTGSPRAAGGVLRIPENRFVSKAGLGVIDGDLLIDIRSGRNALLIGSERWQGLGRRNRQIVHVHGGDVVGSPGDLSLASMLSESVVISFEGRRVYFSDFRSNEGGHYERENP